MKAHRRLNGMLLMTLIWLACGLSSVCAQQNLEVNLSKCLQMALDNDSRVKLAMMEQQKLQAGKSETIGSGMPQISASGQFQDFLKLPTQLIPGEFFGQEPGSLIPVQFGTNYNMSGGINVSQLIYSQSYLTAIQISNRLLAQNDLDVERNRQNVIYDVTQLYLVSLLTKAQLNYMSENLGKIDTLSALAQSHYENGFLKKIDVDRIKVSRINLLSEIQNLSIMLTQQLNMIKFFAGINLQDSLVLTESIHDLNALMPVTLNTDNHIDLQLLDNQKRLAVLQMRMVRAECLPSLGFFGNFSYNSQQNEFGKLFSDSKGWLGTSLIGVSLNVPIFSGMTKYYKLSQARIQSNQIGLMRDYSKNLIDTQVKNAADKLSSATQQSIAQQENVKLASEVYAVIYDQYKQGFAPLTDLLNASTALITAQSGEIQAMAQMKLAELELCKATGSLSSIVNK
jgi:outer membrane protein